MIEATVIIPVWNAEQTLERSFNSALAQTEVSLEVIIVDDASPDGTLLCARRLAANHANVRVLSLATNSGPAAARNAALDVAQGRWIAVLDSDDAFGTGRLRRLIDFAAQKQADIVCDDLLLVDEAGEQRAAPPLAFPGDAQSASWSVSDYIHGNRIRAGKLGLGYLKPVFERAFLDRHRLRYDENLRNGEDFHFVLHALMAGANVWHLDDAGYLYSVRSGSVSNRLNPDHAQALARADEAFLERFKDDLSQPARALMLQRMNDNADLATTEIAMQALKAGHLTAAARALVQRPRALRRFALQLVEAGRKRLDLR